MASTVPECVSHLVLGDMLNEMLPGWEIITSSKWSSAFLATAAVSVLPNVLLYLLPASMFDSAQKKGRSLNYVNFLLCFSSAALLGDVFFHVLPHLLNRHTHDGHHHHEHSNEHLHDHDCTSHEHDAHSIIFPFLNDTIYKKVGIEREVALQVLLICGFFMFFVAEKLVNRWLSHDHSTEHRHQKNESHLSKQSTLTASAVLNLVVDGLHNFTDGIALGASFASGRSLALATFVSIICHEVPHELGDFSVLVSNGFSKSEAISAQYLTALGAFLGTALGLLADRNEFFEDVLVAVTAGGFLYVATVVTFPKLVSENCSVLQLAGECVMFVAGLAIMLNLH